MSAILYIDTTDKNVYSFLPDVTGKAVIGLDLPPGVPVQLLITQVQAFIAGITRFPIPVIIKATFADPPMPPPPSPSPSPAPEPSPSPSPAPEPSPSPSPSPSPAP